MSRGGQNILTEISRGTTNGAVQNVLREVPKEPAKGGGQSILKKISRGKNNGAGQSILKTIPKNTASLVGQIVLGEIPRDAGASGGQSILREIPRDTANAVWKAIPKSAQVDKANGQGQSTCTGIGNDPLVAQGQSTPREVPRDKAATFDQSTHGEVTRDTVRGAGESIREIPGETAAQSIPMDSSAEQSIIMETSNMESYKVQRDISLDTSNEAGQDIIGEIPRDTAKDMEQSILKDTAKDEDQSILSEKPRDTIKAEGHSTYSSISEKEGHSVESSEPRACHQNFASWTMLFSLAAPAVLAALCFVRSLFGEFVHDDVWAILNNPDSRGDTPLSSIFSNDFWGKAMSDNSSHKSYRPLCVLSFRINVLFGGMEAFYFHAVNVILHCMVSSLLMYTCHKVVFDDRRLALATALLFSAHPIHTEAVAGIVGRADVLSCLLFLLTFLSYIRSVEIGPVQDIFPSTSAPLFLLLSLILGTCAMLVKETGVTIFGVCLVYDLLCLCPRKFKRTPDQPRSIWYVARPFLKRAALVSCHVTLVLYFRLRIMGGSMPLFSEQDNPASFSPYILTRFLTHSYLLAFNAWLLLAPITLCYDWQVGSIPLIHSIWDERNMGTLLLLVILVSLGFHCLTAAKRLEHRALLVGLLFLIFPFIPASNLFFRVGFVVAERVLYMPSMGFCILCVHGMKVLFSRSSSRGSSALTLCFLLLLVLFSCKTVSQSKCWMSREALFRSGVQTLPHNAKVHYNYANFLKDQNRKDEAINHYKTVLSLYTQHPSALNNLGTLTSNATAAEEYYRKALKISPQHSRALFNLGNLLRTQSRDEEAERLLRESLIHGSYFADAYSSLGSLLTDQKRHREAEEIYQEGIKNCPDSSDLQNNYGVFLVDVGSQQKAVSHYLHALRLRPDHHVAMLNLGRLHRSLGQNIEAEKWYKKALQISHDPDVITPLGALYYNTGKYEEALHLYKEAVDTHPSNMQIRLSLVQVLIVMGQPQEAESLALDIADEFDNCLECFRLLSAIYTKEENYPKALEMIDIALQMKPKDPKIISELHFSRGNQLRELNQLEEAFQSYSKVADLVPNQAQAWMNMGGIKHMQGDYSAARSFYKKALLLDPNSKLLKENLAKLKRLENKMQTSKGGDPDSSREQQGASEMTPGTH
ncbi:protein O-mannosyl-transferase TMTC1 [Discoglossus pictus]